MGSCETGLELAELGMSLRPATGPCKPTQARPTPQAAAGSFLSAMEPRPLARNRHEATRRTGLASCGGTSLALGWSVPGREPGRHCGHRPRAIPVRPWPSPGVRHAPAGPTAWPLPLAWPCQAAGLLPTYPSEARLPATGLLAEAAPCLLPPAQLPSTQASWGSAPVAY